ncbi:MAG: (d)CMP kinase [Clostridia bacterium]|nr:(d)CMP kinase [Clostridia bacterium]
MIQIAIDGPSGAGKSTLAKILAAKLGFIYVDTGALYRSIGLYMETNGIDPKDSEAVVASLPKITLALEYHEGSQVVLLNGENVGERIRTPQISMYASAVSAIPAVRAFLLDTQRDIAAKNNVIMDGRDIGTVILPNADVKIFLVSSFETRARRRVKELLEKGIEASYEEVLADMIERDKNDSSRAVAPLVPAEDAVHLDNSELTLEGTVDAALAIIREKCAL